MADPVFQDLALQEPSGASSSLNRIYVMTMCINSIRPSRFYNAAVGGRRLGSHMQETYCFPSLNLHNR